MHVPFTTVALAWLVFSGQAFLVIRLVERLTPQSARIAPVDDRLLGALAVATGCVGAWHVAHAAPLGSLVTLAFVCTTLDYACALDLRDRRIPVALAAPALLLVAALDAVDGNWSAFLAGTAILLPFAVVAWRTQGRGTGWGDAEVAGLGGFALGLELGIIAVAAACFAAAGFGYARKRANETIAFAPYLALAIQAAFLIPLR